MFVKFSNFSDNDVVEERWLDFYETNENLN